MNQIDVENEGWQACKSGELVRFAAKEKSRIARRTLIQIGGAAALVAFVGILLSFRQSEPAEPNYGGIRCSVVRSKAKAHLDGTLDAATEAKIAQHLEQCPLCVAYLKQKSNQQSICLRK